MLRRHNNLGSYIFYYCRPKPLSLHSTGVFQNIEKVLLLYIKDEKDE